MDWVLVRAATVFPKVTMLRMIGGRLLSHVVNNHRECSVY
jgi:hypothetical protein